MSFIAGYNKNNIKPVNNNKLSDYVYYDVVQIDIILYKTIPGEKTTKLTSSILYDPKRTSKVILSETPFFTDNIKLPYSALYAMPYQERVNFFFNEEEFKRIIQVFILKKLVKNEDKSPINRYKIARENIQKMLQLLFSTTIPATGNITNTFDEFIKHDSNISISTRVLNNVPKYTYLKSGMQVYTVTKVRVINDIINHPLFNEIVNILLNFNEWRKNQKMIIDLNIKQTKLDLLKRLFSEGSNSLDITKYLDDFEKLHKANQELLSAAGKRVISSDISLLIQLLDEIIKNIKYIKDIKDEKKNIENIIDKIEDEIRNNNNNSGAFDIFDKLEKIIIEIKDNFSKYKNKNKEDIPTNISLFDDKFKQIMKYLTRIETQEKIGNKYFGEQPYFNFSGESDEIKDIIKKDYGKLFEFIDKIKEITIPKRMSTNEKLQKMIKNFIDSNDVVENSICDIQSLIKLVTIINDEIIINPNKKKCLKGSKKDLLNTDLIIVDRQRYEIYLAIDTIEAEVNEQNTKEYSCIYKDYMLTRMLTSIFEFSKKKYSLDSNRIILTKEEISKCKNCKFGNNKEEKQNKLEKKVENKENENKNIDDIKLDIDDNNMKNKIGGNNYKITKKRIKRIKRNNNTRKLYRKNQRYFYYMN